ncbi:hypothetical protein NBRC116590_16580 [Pelagimonas sp. KU-00592-HH]|uniref:DUF6455 family protein n=1 Tax=Pelagimonas sp. KU-00592-HH TaxID=3127651 RepID=UPI0031040B5C
MPDRADLKRHADLVDRTATRLGIDLEDAALSGRLAFDDIAEMVMRCTNCSNPEDCAHWLNRDEARADAPPVYCCNANLLADLKEVSA